MEKDISQLRETWKQLGIDDPFWAVVSHPEKRGGRWNPAEFFETGEQTVARVSDLLNRHAKAKPPFGRVLDFGCGLGRLTAPLGHRAEEVIGVDISEPMIQQARQMHADQHNTSFILNERADLGCFPENSFDLVLSLICLQHMPWPIASGYVREFARVVKPDGLVVFQLPSRTLKPNRCASWRQALVEGLPFGLGKVYRRWKHGTSAVFAMHYTPRLEVERLASSLSLSLIACEADTMAGPNTESFLYMYRSPWMSSWRPT